MSIRFRLFLIGILSILSFSLAGTTFALPPRTYNTTGLSTNSVSQGTSDPITVYGTFRQVQSKPNCNPQYDTANTYSVPLAHHITDILNIQYRVEDVNGNDMGIGRGLNYGGDWVLFAPGVQVRCGQYYTDAYDAADNTYQFQPDSFQVPVQSLAPGDYRLAFTGQNTSCDNKHDPNDCTVQDFYDTHPSFYFTVVGSPPPPTGTVCVVPNISTYWDISGPVGYSGSGGGQTCYSDSPTGDYTIYSPAISGYQGPSYSPSQTQSLGANETIYFYVNYTENPQPPTVNLTGSTTPGGSQSNGPINISYDSGVYLTWTSTNTTQCYLYLNGGYTGYSGTSLTNLWSGNLGTNRTYSVSCDGPGGSATDSLVVNVNSPTVDITASPTSVSYAGSSTLSWTATSAGSCTASGDWSGNKAISGNQSTGSLTQVKTYSYTITCTGNGSASDTATVTVGPAQPPVVDLRCDSSSSCGSVTYGTSRTLSWTLSGFVDSCTASGSWSGSKSTGGGSENSGAITSDRTWTLTCTGPGGQGSDSVSATVPAPSADIQCDNSNGPCNVAWNGSPLIEWCGSNAQACSGASTCSVTRNGSSWATGISGAQNTGVQSPGNYTYTLSCVGNGTNNDSVTVSVAAPVPTASSVTYSTPDYCSSGPGGYVAWSYTDASGSPQTSYQVQITNTGNFNSPMYDSGQVNSSSRVFAIPNGVLSFNVTYRARVRVWNSYNSVSDWSNPSDNWKTPSYAYPQVDFTWTPAKPQTGVAAQFTDQTVFGGGNPNNRQWSWNFGDGGTSAQQSPSHSFANPATYTVTLTATDAANQSCSRQKTVNVQKPIPIIKEVAPK